MGDASSDVRWFRAPLSTIGAGSGDELVVHLHGTASARLWNSRVFSFAHDCVGCKTLADHSVALSLSRAIPMNEAVALVELFSNAGVLRPFVVPSAVPHNGKIDVVAVTTCDRSEYLSVCLESIAKQVRHFGRRCIVLVIDGSRLRKGRAANRRIVASMRATLSCQYFGPREIARVAAELSTRAGTDLRWALKGGSVGANRNVATLLAAGRDLLMVDDDIVLSPWTLAEPTGIKVVGHRDGRVSHFCRSRSELFGLVRWSPVDLLSAHETLLGSSLDAVCSGGADTSEACSDILGAVCDGAQPEIVATQAGILGDPGLYCPYQLLLGKNATSDKLLHDEAQLDAALRFRCAVRAAETTIVSHEISLMTYCTGLSNRRPRVPFMPLGRNEDGTFGTMSSFVNSNAMVGHLAFGVVHDSGRSFLRDDSPMVSARQTRISEVLTALTQFVSASSKHLSGEDERRLALAATLEEWGQLDRGAFWRSVGELMITVRSRQLASLDLRQRGSSHRAKKEIASYRSAIATTMSTDGFAIPSELVEREASTSATQEYLVACGGLLRVWPFVWRESARLSWLDTRALSASSN